MTVENRKEIVNSYFKLIDTIQKDMGVAIANLNYNEVTHLTLKKIEHTKQFSKNINLSQEETDTLTLIDKLHLYISSYKEFVKYFPMDEKFFRDKGFSPLLDNGVFTDISSGSIEDFQETIMVFNQDKLNLLNKIRKDASNLSKKTIH